MGLIFIIMEKSKSNYNKLTNKWLNKTKGQYKGNLIFYVNLKFASKMMI